MTPVPIEFFSHIGFDNTTGKPRDKSSTLFVFDTKENKDDSEWLCSKYLNLGLYSQSR